MLKAVEKRILADPEMAVPRIYLYFNKRNPNLKRKEIGGIDYLGYIILAHNTNSPYYVVDGEKIYLTAKEIEEMKTAIAEAKSNRRKRKKNRNVRNNGITYGKAISPA